MTDTRGNKPPYETYGAGQPQPAAQPYHPPQAYPSPGGGATQAGQGSKPAGQQGQQGASVTSAPSATGTAGGGGSAAPTTGPAAASAVRLPRTGARTTPRTRKARLRVSKADPWSVMKVSFLLSIALGVCTIVAAAVLWMVMDAMGVFSTVGGTISEATGSNESNGFDLQSFLSLPRVLVFTSVIAVIDVVLATALATLGAFIYNLSAGFVGGVELTLAEDE
ncbi:DUF3566 domain-containing protein [Streptomyces sp. NPDC096310]|uniref:DUF3566 domain-containing protein n=1 Tax=Streptomyces sp. NPDC096310 TaxID=3366082 RepID=UPI0038252DCC